MRGNGHRSLSILNPAAMLNVAVRALFPPYDCGCHHSNCCPPETQTFWSLDFYNLLPTFHQSRSNCDQDRNESNLGSSRWTAAAEIMLIFLMFFLYAGWPPPDVNEAHYLAKAKHYWQPAWCPTDHFLESADAHLVFYWTFGWLTRLSPLPVAAWLGRFFTWFLLAWSWRRLSWAVIPRPFASLLTAWGFLLFSGRCHMAGEWVVGGVEAKGIAYALVFLPSARSCVSGGISPGFCWGRPPLFTCWSAGGRWWRQPAPGLRAGTCARR